jgi:ABC-type transport system involved in cytochrome c biogenesis permease subunit
VFEQFLFLYYAMLFYLILYDFTNYGIRDLIYGNNEENGLLEAVFVIAKLINSFIFLDHLETIKETLFFFLSFFFLLFLMDLSGGYQPQLRVTTFLCCIWY